MPPVVKARQRINAPERSCEWLVTRTLQGLYDAVRSDDRVTLNALATRVKSSKAGGTMYPELTAALHIVAKKVLRSFDEEWANSERNAEKMDKWLTKMVVALATEARTRKLRVGARREEELHKRLKESLSGKDITRPFGRDPHQLIVRRAFEAFGLAKNADEAHNLTKSKDQAE